MNDWFQNILVFIIAGLALAFLVKKYFWKSKKKATKSCGNDGCGCA